MKVEVIKTLNEYLSLIHQNENFDKNWYRGHTETSYRLEPTLYRCKKQILSGDGEFKLRHFEVEDEELAINQFKARSPISVENYIPNDLDYLYVMQHNGIKTRLLDFTINPLVALYFSVCKTKEFNSHYEFEENCSNVFCVNPKIINRESLGIESVVDLSYLQFEEVRNLFTPVCIEPKNEKIDNRLKAQFGKFVLFGKETFPLDWYEIHRKQMLKILIPNSKRDRILNELNRKYNINCDTIFPDTAITKDFASEVNKNIKGVYKKL